MAQLDTSVRELLLNEISNIFHDESDPSVPMGQNEPLVYNLKPKRKRHESVEEVVEGDPFAGLEDGNDMLMEPKIELHELKVEPADTEFHFGGANNEAEEQTHIYLEDFQNGLYGASPAVIYGSGDAYSDNTPSSLPETFTCTVCNSVFVEESRLRIHMSRKHNLLKHTFNFNCDICGESYDQKNSLFVHIKRRHGPKAIAKDDDKTEVTCDICGSVLLGKRRLRFHIHRKHNAQDKPFKYKCSKCPNTYDKLLSLKLHKKRKHGSYTRKNQHIRCPVCPKQFNNRSSYMAHLRRIHQSSDGTKIQPKNSAGISESTTLDIPITYGEGNNELACSLCPLLFADINRLRVHMKRVHNANAESFRYKCSFCSLTYDKRASLVRHVTRKHNKDLFCETCKKQFSTQESFHNHSHSNANIDEQTPVYQCGLCKMIYLREGTLVKHMRSAHDITTTEMTVFCHLCGKGFYQQKYLKSHLSKMHSDLTYTCQFCNNIFNLKSTLRQHINRHHLATIKQSANATFHCSHCSDSFPNEKDLCNHITSYHTNAADLKIEVKEEANSIRETEGENDIKPDLNKPKSHLQCTECGKQFEVWEKLRQHFKMQHLDEENKSGQVVCQHCGLVTTACSLSRHLVIAHKDLIEVFRCQQCNYKTSKKHLLAKHQQSHTMEKKYSCPVEGCPYKTHNKHNMRPHSVTHKDKVKLYCSRCPFGTNDPHIMKNHENEHVTGKKRYNCDKCDYSTNLPANIISHRFKHSDERSFKCNECQFDTKYSTALWLHKRQKHSDKPPLQIGKKKLAKPTENKDVSADLKDP